MNGTTVKAADLAGAVEPVLAKTGKDRRAEVQLTGAKAAFSTADAEKLGIKRVTGEFTTYFPYAYYRNVNINRAAQLINNTVLKPGEDDRGPWRIVTGDDGSRFWTMDHYASFEEVVS